MSRFIYVSCPECGFIRSHIQYKLHNDPGILEYKCIKNHVNNVVVQNFDFEILLGMAIESMCDEYYREAVFNFASALEKCREFALGLSKKEYSKFWKCIKNQSERQLGTFVGLFLFRFGINFSLNEPMQNIRNNVIHKGTIVLYEEAEKYGEYVLKEIQNIISELVLNVDKKIFNDFKVYKLTEKTKEIKKGQITTIDLGILSFGTTTDEEEQNKQRLRTYARLHEEEYKKMVYKANSIGKVLNVNEKNELVLVDAPDPFARQQDEKYVPAYNSLSQAIEHYNLIKQHYELAEQGKVKPIKIMKD